MEGDKGESGREEKGGRKREIEREGEGERENERPGKKAGYRGQPYFVSK